MCVRLLGGSRPRQSLRRETTHHPSTSHRLACHSANVYTFLQYWLATICFTHSVNVGRSLLCNDRNIARRPVALAPVSFSKAIESPMRSRTHRELQRQRGPARPSHAHETINVPLVHSIESARTAACINRSSHPRPRARCVCSMCTTPCETFQCSLPNTMPQTLPHPHKLPPRLIHSHSPRATPPYPTISPSTPLPPYTAPCL